MRSDAAATDYSTTRGIGGMNYVACHTIFGTMSFEAAANIGAAIRRGSHADVAATALIPPAQINRSSRCAH